MAKRGIPRPLRSPSGRFRVPLRGRLAFTARNPCRWLVSCRRLFRGTCGGAVRKSARDIGPRRLPVSGRGNWAHDFPCRLCCGAPTAGPKCAARVMATQPIPSATTSARIATVTAGWASMTVTASRKSPSDTRTHLENEGGALATRLELLGCPAFVPHAGASGVGACRATPVLSLRPPGGHLGDISLTSPPALPPGHLRAPVGPGRLAQLKAQPEVPTVRQFSARLTDLLAALERCRRHPTRPARYKPPLRGPGARPPDRRDPAASWLGSLLRRAAQDDWFQRAGDGTRTRDHLLGRQALYQLSYSRVAAVFYPAR